MRIGQAIKDARWGAEQQEFAPASEGLATMSRVLRLLLVGGLSTGCFAAPIIYDTTSTGNGGGTGSYVAVFGNGGNAQGTFGEFFVAPAGATTFNSISFNISVRPGTAPAGPQTVDAYLALWDSTVGGPVAGSPLASVTGLVIPGTSTTIYDHVTANFGSVAVSAGQLYVAYFTVLNASGRYPGTVRYAFEANYPAPDQYGGRFVFNNYSTLAELSDGSRWGDNLLGPLAFIAVFDGETGAPELQGGQATLPLTICCLALLAYRPRRARQTA